MKVAFLCTVLTLMVSGCTSISKEYRLTSDIQSVEFNSLVSEYKTRPTFISIREMSDGDKSLVVEMDGYGTSRNGINSNISISKQNIDENILVLEKFIRWNKLALQRKEQFTKEIDIAKANPSGLIENRYTFHSGNEKHHYVEIVTCAIGTCNPSEKAPIMLNANGAIKLIQELKDFKNDKIVTTDVNDIYN